MHAKQLRDLVDDRRRNHRLIALHVHDDVRVAPTTRRRHFGDSVGTRDMGARGHGHVRAESPRGNRDAFIVRGNHHLRRTAGTRALVHPLQHGFAGEWQQCLARQSRGIETRGNDDTKSHEQPLSLQQGIVGSELARVFLEHHRHAIT